MDQSKILNKANFKVWTRLGMRATFGVAALEMGNTIQTIRCCEQIKVNLGYMKQKVCMVGLASGLALGTLGFTHCCIEDVGILRSIPNLTIISPADSGETVKAVLAGIKHKNSVYIRLTCGSNINQIYEDNYDFEIGKSITLKKGKDISIFAAGTMVKVALDCAKILSENNIDAEVVNMHTIKPIDFAKIKESAKSSKLIVSIEEHNIIGGLGSAIAESLSSIENSPKHIFFGINDSYSKGGEYDFLKEKFGLTSKKISEKIILTLKK